MRVKNTKVTFAFSIPIDKPDENGVVYTEEAVKNAVNNLHSNLPVVYKDAETDTKVIGVTGNSRVVYWDSENQVCKITVDGVLFYSGAEIFVNEIKDGKISSFEIANIGLTI